MTIKLGNDNISKIYLGSQEVDKMYLGTDLFYEKPASLPAISVNDTIITLNGINVPDDGIITVPNQRYGGTPPITFSDLVTNEFIFDSSNLTSNAKIHLEITGYESNWETVSLFCEYPRNDSGLRSRYVRDTNEYEVISTKTPALPAGEPPQQIELRAKNQTAMATLIYHKSTNDTFQSINPDLSSYIKEGTKIVIGYDIWTKGTKTDKGFKLNLLTSYFQDKDANITYFATKNT